MIRQIFVVFDSSERQAFRTASNWARPEDADDDAAPLILLLARDGRPFSADEIERALRELLRTQARVQSNSLVGLPDGLVAPGTDLVEVSDDIAAVSARELEPAMSLLRHALGAQR